MLASAHAWDDADEAAKQKAADEAAKKRKADEERETRKTEQARKRQESKKRAAETSPRPATPDSEGERCAKILKFIKRLKVDYLEIFASS